MKLKQDTIDKNPTIKRVIAYYYVIITAIIVPYTILSNM